MITDSEIAHLSAPMQIIKGRGNLFRLHQHVGCVQQQNIDAIRSQPLQTSFGRIDNVLAGQIHAFRPIRLLSQDLSALGLDHDLLAQSGRALEHLAEDPLGSAIGIEIGVIEQGDAVIVRGMNQRVRLRDIIATHELFDPAGQFGAAIADAGDGQIRVRDPISFHRGFWIRCDNFGGPH
jgi:hypothetical protein